MKEEYKDIVVLDFFSLFRIRREARRAPSLVKLLGSLDVRAFFRWFSADVTGAVHYGRFGQKIVQIIFGLIKDKTKFNSDQKLKLLLNLPYLG